MSQITTINITQLVLAISLLIVGIYLSIGAYRFFKASRKEMKRLKQKLNELNNQQNPEL